MLRYAHNPPVIIGIKYQDLFLMTCKMWTMVVRVKLTKTGDIGTESMH